MRCSGQQRYFIIPANWIAWNWLQERETDRQRGRERERERVRQTQRDTESTNSYKICLSTQSCIPNVSNTFLVFINMARSNSVITQGWQIRVNFLREVFRNVFDHINKNVYYDLCFHVDSSLKCITNESRNKKKSNVDNRSEEKIERKQGRGGGEKEREGGGRWWGGFSFLHEDFFFPRRPRSFNPLIISLFWSPTKKLFFRQLMFQACWVWFFYSHLLTPARPNYFA